MSVLDFYPVEEKKNFGRLNNSTIKSVVFGCDNMTTLTNRNVQVENNFPWSLLQDKIDNIVQPYLKKDSDFLVFKMDKFYTIMESNLISFILMHHMSTSTSSMI